MVMAIAYTLLSLLAMGVCCQLLQCEVPWAWVVYLGVVAVGSFHLHYRHSWGMKISLVAAALPLLGLLGICRSMFVLINIIFSFTVSLGGVSYADLYRQLKRR